jgi:hypothetical protein
MAKSQAQNFGNTLPRVGATVIDGVTGGAVSHVQLEQHAKHVIAVKPARRVADDFYPIAKVLVTQT